jgi:hypothetical protein
MMKHLLVKAREIFLLCLFLFLPTFLGANEFVMHDGIVDERAVAKIEEMGEELYRKSGVKVFLTAKKSAEGEDIFAYEKRLSATLNSPHVLLTLFLEEKKVDIYTSQGLEKEFDKEGMLSPLPWKGTIIPLLTEKKKVLDVTPALLNGYADIVDQIASYRKIHLESSIGSANKDTLNIVKLLVYGFVAVLVILMLIRRMKERANAKS